MLSSVSPITENLTRGMAGDPILRWLMEVKALPSQCITVECRDSQVVITNVILKNSGQERFVVKYDNI